MFEIKEEKPVLKFFVSDGKIRKDFRSVREASKWLDVSPSTAERAFKEGRLLKKRFWIDENTEYPDFD